MLHINGIPHGLGRLTHFREIFTKIKVGHVIDKHAFWLKRRTKTHKDNFDNFVTVENRLNTRSRTK
jgi:hypothetical protein